MMATEEIRRFEWIDLNILDFLGEGCIVRSCSLESGHDGPHAEVNPYSGLVYYVWHADPAEFSISPRAIKVALRINSLRDEIADAISAAEMYEATIKNQYRTLTCDEDPALYAILHDRDIWPGNGDVNESGFEAGDKESLRAELVDIYNLDGSD